MVAEAMRRIGASVVTQHELFKSEGILPQDERDEVWLRHCGKQGWAVITKDHRVRTREIEREAYLRERLCVFIWKDNDATGEAMSEAVAESYPAMLKAVRDWLPPFIARIGLNCRVLPIEPEKPNRRAAVKKR